MSKKAQFATEHILVVAFGLLIIVPIVYFFYTYSIGQVEEVSLTQINKMGNDIINNAETVYYMGKPSRITLDVNMPDNIENIVILGNKELVFHIDVGMSNYTEMAFSSNVPIVGPYINKTGIMCNTACYSPGLKHITAISQGTNVSIVFK